jgi:2-keto-4-pentenoate hydratase/2-oxohepta-3-ene-1,7-dioic acid hydratase in catechol pathway
MKLISFRLEGETGWGRLDSSTISPAKTEGGSLLLALRDVGPGGLSSLIDDGPTLELAAVQLLPPIFPAEKIFCVGLNYAEHSAEMKRDRTEYPVIGRGGRRIAAEDANDHILGYSIFNDGSICDYQRHSTQFTPGKNFGSSGAFGPAIVTADEIPRVDELSISTVLNGQEVQRSGLDSLLFSIPEIIAYISTWTEPDHQ